MVLSALIYDSVRMLKLEQVIQAHYNSRIIVSDSSVIVEKLDCVGQLHQAVYADCLARATIMKRIAMRS